MQTNHFISNSLGILLLLIASQPEATAQQFVTDKDRPDRSWVRGFDSAEKIIVSTSINEAIERCPEQQYCELMIPSLTIMQTIHISRSRTRFTGMDNNTIRLLDSDETHGYIFQIEHDTSEVMFTNLTINGDAIERKPDIVGIGASASSISKIMISDNTIQGLYGQENAHAIAFYGTGKNDSDAIEHIIIQNNRISDMRTGSSETIAINGNVQYWEINNNDISQINNIAIDAIGGEGTAPVQTLPDGRVAPGPFDAARLGFIENNTISGLSTKNNPAYDDQESWAAAIYIDGAHSIKIHGNTVSHVPWGFEVGAENCVRSSYVQLSANQSSHSRYGDILLGGYSKGGYLENTEINCDPHKTTDDAEGHGYVTRLDVRNNQLNGTHLNNQTFIGNTLIQHRIGQSTIEPPLTKFND